MRNPLELLLVKGAQETPLAVQIVAVAFSCLQVEGKSLLLMILYTLDTEFGGIELDLTQIFLPED